MARLALLIIMLVQTAPAAGETYQYVDEQGNIAYTDNLSTVAENLRSRVKKVEMTPLPTLKNPGPPLQENPPAPSLSLKERFRDWTRHPMFRYVAILSPLAILTLFMLWMPTRIDSLLIRLLFRFLSVVLIGVGLYSAVLLNKIYPLSLSGEEAGHSPASTLDPIQRVRTQRREIERNLQKKTETLDAITENNR